MMTDKLEAAVRNGKRAEILLEDPVLREALDRLEEIETDARLVCSADELVERRANVVAIRRLRQTLRAYIDNGKIAARSLPQ
jgi:hypothetical protein